VGLHVREREPEPRLDQVGDGRDEGDVQLSAGRDPALGRGTVEVADDLGLSGRVAGEPNPDMAAPPFVLTQASDQVADDLAITDGDRAARAFLLPGARDSRARVLDRRQQAL
jgi:hypothetical protein